MISPRSPSGAIEGTIAALQPLLVKGKPSSSTSEHAISVYRGGAVHNRETQKSVRQNPQWKNQGY
jgi:hypothetical protein